jgi:hypothetical protein
MTSRQPPRVALALLERFVPDSGPLAGDLIEDFERRQSSPWFWWQVLAAVSTAWFERPAEIRPLRLVDVQPADALERSRALNLRFRPVNLSASPSSGVGGLGLVVLAFHLSIVTPGAWGLLLASTLTGLSLGIVIIVSRRKPPKAATTIRHDSIFAR